MKYFYYYFLFCMWKSEIDQVHSLPISKLSFEVFATSEVRWGMLIKQATTWNQELKIEATEALRQCDIGNRDDSFPKFLNGQVILIESFLYARWKFVSVRLNLLVIKIFRKNEKIFLLVWVWDFFVFKEYGSRARLPISSPHKMPLET